MGAAMTGLALGSPLLAALARASLEGTVAALVVLALVATVPRTPARLRALLWWLVALRFVAGLVLAALPAAQLDLALLAPQPAPAAEGFAPTPHTPAPRTDALTAEGGSPAPGSAWLAPPASMASAPRATAAPAPPSSPLPRAAIAGVLAAAWALGVLLGVARTGRAMSRARELRRGAQPIGDGPARTALEALVARHALRRTPQLLLSHAIETPLVLGALRPAILLPSRALAELAPGELRLALAHELAHVRRLDLWTGWIPEAAAVLFFFHPLARLAAREHALAREAACDALALGSAGAAPAAYGRLLLKVGVRPRGERAPLCSAVAPAGAATSTTTLRRRLEMLEHVTHRMSRSRKTVLACALAALLLPPFRLVARAAAPEPLSARTPDAERTPTSSAVTPPTPARVATPGRPTSVSAPAAVPAVGAPAAPVPAAGVPTAPVPAIAPRAKEGTARGVTDAPSAPGYPVATIPAIAAIRAISAIPSIPALPGVYAGASTQGASPATPGAASPATPGTPAPGDASYERAIERAQAHAERDREHAERDRERAERDRERAERPRATWSHEDDGWVLLEGDSTSWSGSNADLGRVRRHGGDKGPILWFERGGQQWVVRDEALVREVRSAFDLPHALAHKQAELALRQEEFAVPQAELGVEQAKLGLEQAKLGAELAAVSFHPSRGGVVADKDQAEADRRSEELSRKMDALGDQQHALGQKQEELGRKQEVLGREQEKLGAEQSRLAEVAEGKLREAIDRALAKGLAERVDW